MPQLDATFLLQQLRSDIPDADIAPETWERWSRMVALDLFVRGVWKPVRVAVTITSTGNVADEYYAIPDTIEDVYGVELTDNTTPYHHQDWLDPEEDWQIVDREVRLIDASNATSDRYVIHGRGSYALLSDLRDIYTGLVYHLLRKKYIEQRKDQRANFYKELLDDPTRDTTNTDLSRMLIESEGEITWRLRRLERPEPAIPTPTQSA